MSVSKALWAVICGVIGIRSKQGRQDDAERLSLIQLVLTGITLLVAMLLVLWWLVMQVVSTTG